MMILTDRDLEDREVMPSAIEAVDEALLLKSKGALISLRSSALKSRWWGASTRQLSFAPSASPE
jgi:hypothetical protein